MMLAVHVAFLAAALALVAQAPAAQKPAHALHADGRREAITNPRQDGQGRWTAEVDGRRTPLAAGEIVAIIDSDGKETWIVPKLSDATAPPDASLLAPLKDLKNREWFTAAEKAAAMRTQGMLEALVSLAADPAPELRRRGFQALLRMRTEESARATADLVLAERDSKIRREHASLLFSVQSILRHCLSTETLETGLADKDADVRTVFAHLTPRENRAAIEVLKKDELKHSDHHRRESAALELAERGDTAGEAILIGMLQRTKLPGFDGGDALMEKLLIEEQMSVCRVLAKFGTEKAKAALKQAASSSKLPAVRAAAKAALEGA